MRFSKHHRGSNEITLNVTPMIDVVFFLLIFFMTVTQATESSKTQVELPKQPGVEEPKPSLMTVNVNQQGEFFIMGEKVSLPVAVTKVGAEITRQGNEPSLVTVVIRADERGTSQPVNELVLALARMQISRIRIAVQEPG